MDFSRALEGPRCICALFLSTDLTTSETFLIAAKDGKSLLLWHRAAQKVHNQTRKTTVQLFLCGFTQEPRLLNASPEPHWGDDREAGSTRFLCIYFNLMTRVGIDMIDPARECTAEGFADPMLTGYQSSTGANSWMRSCDGSRLSRWSQMWEHRVTI